MLDFVANFRFELKFHFVLCLKCSYRSSVTHCARVCDSEDKVQKLSDLLRTGKSIGHNICHVWLDGGVFQLTIEKMKGSKYVVAYWKENKTYDDATDFDMSFFELAADLLDELVI